MYYVAVSYEHNRGPKVKYLDLHDIKWTNYAGDAMYFPTVEAAISALTEHLPVLKLSPHYKITDILIKQVES